MGQGPVDAGDAPLAVGPDADQVLSLGIVGEKLSEAAGRRQVLGRVEGGHYAADAVEDGDGRIKV